MKVETNLDSVFTDDDHLNKQESLRAKNLPLIPTSQRLKVDPFELHPDWNKYVKSGEIPENSLEVLENFHSLKTELKIQRLTSNRQIGHIFFEALKIKNDNVVLQFILGCLYEATREDTLNFDYFSEFLPDDDINSLFINLIQFSREKETFIHDKSAYLLSGFLCRPNTEFFTQEHVSRLLNLIFVDEGTKNCFSIIGSFDALGNILKIESYRPMVWDIQAIRERLYYNIDVITPTATLYKAIFCIWLSSFNHDLIGKIIEEKMLQKICGIIKECRTEKVIRVCLHFIKAILVNDEAVEYIIDENILQILILLEYCKWRDKDFYDEVRETMHQLECKMKHFDNFSRYNSELDKHTLKWSFLHSERFWKENVMSFEQDEFLAIKKLQKLFLSTDCVTLAVACHDIGEFARLHPIGRKICEMLRIKDSVIPLIGHENREVAREALLCIQKLMLGS